MTAIIDEAFERVLGFAESLVLVREPIAARLVRPTEESS
jgi:hypothetical protein